VPWFVELNHILRDAMAPYPGLPTPGIGAFRDHMASRPLYQNQAEFSLGMIEMPCNVRTYLANLRALPRTGFRSSAVPVRIARGASSPVRAFAEIAP